MTEKKYTKKQIEVMFKTHIEEFFANFNEEFNLENMNLTNKLMIEVIGRTIVNKLYEKMFGEENNND